MPTTREATPWRAELQDILDVCTQRADLPITLPGCAICARYATDSLPFEALMALLDGLPGEAIPEALAAAADRLGGGPPAVRQQHVNAVTLPVLMDSPGWPLVRSLVIDMADQAIARHFADPRLKPIEDVTLLGFAYGDCAVDGPFLDALTHADGLTGVRSLAFHSTEADIEVADRFWTSPLARRLERIEGVGYSGGPVAGPLALRELGLRSFGNVPDGFTLAPLLDPATSPHLAALTLGAYHEAQAALLEALARENHLLERIGSVTLNLSDFGGQTAGLLNATPVPSGVRNVAWRTSGLSDVSLVHLRGPEHINTLYDFAPPGTDLRFHDRVTGYPGLVFDWPMRDQVSRRVTDLALLLPPDVDVQEVAGFCAGLPDLRTLTLIYPFTEAELAVLFDAEPVRRLGGLTLVLDIDGGQWDLNRTNKTMKANAARYKSGLPPAFLFDLAFGEQTAGIHDLALYTKAVDLTRSPDRVHQCVLRTQTAARAFAARAPRRPVEMLTFDFDLRINKAVATAMTATDLFARVYRWHTRAKFDEAGASVLADSPHLRGVREFYLWINDSPAAAVRALLASPHLAGVWDADVWLPEPTPENAFDAACAAAPLLDRVVMLNLFGPDQFPAVPRGGRLGRLRRVGSWLTMYLFGDARGAAAWSAAPVGRPLRARLGRFVEQTYRVEHGVEALPDLEAALTLPAFQDEGGFERALRALLATAFAGKPVAAGTPFADLNDQQQRALRAVARLDADWWCLGAMVSDLMRSYGFEFRDKERLDQYVAGTEE